jgi:urease accessory protein
MRALLTLAALLAPLPALAHPGGDHVHGFVAGFVHPLGGLDHLVAMIAVGAWAALAGGRAAWALPAAFLGGMAGGALLGATGLALPMVEPGILATIIVLGALLAMGGVLNMAVAAPMVALFGLLHGHAHGTEMAGGAAGYALGFLLATASLHGLGLLAGWRAGEGRGRIALRAAGGAAASLAALALVL